MAKAKRLSEAVEEYLMLGEGTRSQATTKQDTWLLNMMVTMIGDRVLANITPDHIAAWFYGPGGLRKEHKVQSLRAKAKGAMLPPISAQTHNHYRSRISAFFWWCESRGEVQQRFVFDTFDRQRGRIRPLDKEDRERQRPKPQVLLQLLDRIQSPRDRAGVAVLLNTALRGVDVRNLRVGNVDLDSGFIATRIRKTKRSDNIPITARLDQELRQWLTIYTEELGRPPAPNDYLLPVMRGGYVVGSTFDEEGNRVCLRAPTHWEPTVNIGERHLGRVVKDALGEMGLSTFGEGTHTIRRAVARAYYDQVRKEEGAPSALRATMTLLGHSDTAMTETYLGVSVEKEERDQRMRGKPFLEAMVSQENVVPLRPVAGTSS